MAALVKICFPFSIVRRDLIRCGGEIENAPKASQACRGSLPPLFILRATILSHGDRALDGGDAGRLRQGRAASANHDVRGRTVGQGRQAAQLQHAGAASRAAGGVSRGGDHREGLGDRLCEEKECCHWWSRRDARSTATRSSSTTAATQSSENLTGYYINAIAIIYGKRRPTVEPRTR